MILAPDDVSAIRELFGDRDDILLSVDNHTFISPNISQELLPIAKATRFSWWHKIRIKAALLCNEYYSGVNCVLEEVSPLIPEYNLRWINAYVIPHKHRLQIMPTVLRWHKRDGVASSVLVIPSARIGDPHYIWPLIVIWKRWCARDSSRRATACILYEETDSPKRINPRALVSFAEKIGVRAHVTDNLATLLSASDNSFWEKDWSCPKFILPVFRNSPKSQAVGRVIEKAVPIDRHVNHALSLSYALPGFPYKAVRWASKICGIPFSEDLCDGFSRAEALKLLIKVSDDDDHYFLTEKGAASLAGSQHIFQTRFLLWSKYFVKDTLSHFNHTISSQYILAWFRRWFTKEESNEKNFVWIWGSGEPVANWTYKLNLKSDFMITYRPDGVFVYEHKGNRRLAFIECDGWRQPNQRQRSRATFTSWMRKAKIFARYLASKEWSYLGDYPPIALVITENLSRAILDWEEVIVSLKQDGLNFLPVYCTDWSNLLGPANGFNWHSVWDGRQLKDIREVLA